MPSRHAAQRPPHSSRRRGQWVLLVLGVAVAILGGIGLERYVATFWLYRGFSPPSQARFITYGTPPHRHHAEVFSGKLTSFELDSAALGGRQMKVLVYLPPGYSKRSRTHYPVVYLLHGEPGSPAQFVDIGDVEVDEDDLLAKKQIAPMMLVMAPGGTNFFSDTEWANLARPGNEWNTYLAEEVVTAVDHRYRAIESGRDRAIAGLSEGGYGAINIAFHHPGEFDVIESWSGYYYADRAPSLFNHDVELERENSPRLEIPQVKAELRATHAYLWFYSGLNDGGEHAGRSFAQQLFANHIASHYSIQRGRHNWGLWRRLMPESLKVASAYFTHGLGAAERTGDVPSA